MSLLQETATYENIESAFYACLQGKRNEISPQRAFLKLDEFIKKIQNNLLSGELYPWGDYKEFYVCDPKRRLVSSAPFVDRVAHRAIYQVLDPIVDSLLIENTFACRKNKGNGKAVATLQSVLKTTPNYNPPADHRRTTCV